MSKDESYPIHTLVIIRSGFHVIDESASMFQGQDILGLKDRDM
jgi:hypothetical protein